MKWRNKYGDRFEWHKWYTWYPVSIDGYWYWCEWVEKRLCYNLGGSWDEYRLTKNFIK